MASLRDTSFIDGDQWEDEELEDNFVDESAEGIRNSGFLPSNEIEEILPRQIRESSLSTDKSRQSVGGIGDAFGDTTEDQAELFEAIEEGYVEEEGEEEETEEEERVREISSTLPTTLPSTLPSTIPNLTPIDFPQAESRELTLYNYLYQSIEKVKTIYPTEVVTNNLFCKLYYGVTYSPSTEKILMDIVSETGLRSYFV